MTGPSVSVALRDRVRDAWTLCPVAFPNGGWHLPTAPDLVEYDPAAAPEKPWVMVEADHHGVETGFVGSVGCRLGRKSGVFWVHVFAPTGSGDEEAERLMDAMTTLLASSAFGGVATGAPSPSGSGPGDDAGQWWRLSSSIPFFVHFKI